MIGTVAVAGVSEGAVDGAAFVSSMSEVCMVVGVWASAGGG